MATFKRILPLFLIAGLLASPLAWAQDDKDERTTLKASDKKKSKNIVGQAISELPLYNNEKPKTKARYYVYYTSASWCGPCNNMMPKVVEAYKEMKKSGKIELIMVSWDEQQEKSEEFLQKFEAPFAAVSGKQTEKLPGYQWHAGIPHMTIVDAQGNLVKCGYAHEMIGVWKDAISEYHANKKGKKKAAAADDKDDDAREKKRGKKSKKRKKSKTEDS